MQALSPVNVSVRSYKVSHDFTDIFLILLGLEFACVRARFTPLWSLFSFKESVSSLMMIIASPLTN